MKAICLWYMLVQLGKGYSTNATAHLTVRHLNHHDGNLKSCKGNSPSSGQVLLLAEINGWRFALILLHGLQPQQQNSHCSSDLVERNMQQQSSCQIL